MKSNNYNKRGIFKRGDTIIKAKYFFNVFTIITILVLMMCQPFSAMGTIDYSYKLDKNLVDKIKDIDEKEKVDVSIWFNNIDYNTINDKLKEKIGDKVTTQIFGYVCDDYSEKSDRKFRVRKKNQLPS